MVQYEKRIADVVSQDPNVDSLMASVGGTTASNLGGPNYGQLVVHLKPRVQRKLGVNDIIKELRPKLAAFAGMNSYLLNPPTIQIGGQVTKSLYQFSMQTPDKQELYAQTERLKALVERVPGVVDVASDVAVSTPQVNVTIDRDKAAAMSVNANTIENALYDAYGPRWVSTIYGSVNEYKVLLELEPKYQADPNALSLLYFKNTNSKLIPLDTMADIQTETGPQTINHYGQLPSATISFNLKPGAALGEVVSQIQGLASRELPDTISTQFQGAAKAFQSSLGNLWVLLIIAIMVVYIVLGILYESYIHPITILSGLPSAGFGALLTLVVFKMDLSIYAFVGLIMLIGIVKKNAIMQIDFALEAERQHGLPPERAIYEGCLIRFRPIMMTTMAALLGAVPIALGYGAGGEARQPLGLVVVGGLLFSQLVTLYLTPVFYIYMSALQEKVQHWRRRGKRPVVKEAPVAG
jgi:HAE1 family hydrophobic/amphiphilic exporter-1